MAATSLSVRSARRVRGSRKRERLDVLVEGTPRVKMLHQVRPMLATLVDRPFDREGWIFEPKWDGYRAIAEVSAGGEVRLYSRNHLSFESKFAPVVHALRSLGHDAVLDGEVVAVDELGQSQFQLLQNYQKTGEGQLLYYVFDLLLVDGHDLRRLPLTRRKDVLAEIIGKGGVVRLSEHVEQRGLAFFSAAEAHHLEGIIAKNGQSPYVEGARGRDWLKIKTHRRQEAVIAGFTEPKGGRKHLGALILGVYEGGELTYIGHTGGGFSTKELASVRAKLEPYRRSTSPFADPPRTNAPVHWVEPELVCEVSFQEWTSAGIARHPIFVGFREDKPARDVRRELPVDVARAVDDAASKRPSPQPSPRRRSRKTPVPTSSGRGLG